MAPYDGIFSPLFVEYFLQVIKNVCGRQSLPAPIFARYALCFSWLICLYLSMISPPFLPVSAGHFTIAGGCSVWYNVGKGLPWTEYSTFGSAVSARAARCIFPLLPFDNWSHLGGRARFKRLFLLGSRGDSVRLGLKGNSLF